MDYDVIVIGAGWAGFTAATKAVQSGLSVALIEKDATGGTCLNRGCIPTKSLIQSAKIYSQCKKSAQFGIESAAPEAPFSRIQERKDRLVAVLRQNMESALSGVDLIRGQARLLSGNLVEVGGRKLSGKSILLACGSKPAVLPSLPFDGAKVLSSDDLLMLKELPDSLLIVGGGVIGCEFASLFSALGSRVSIVEKMPQLLPGEDRDVARKLETSFKKKRIAVATGADAASAALSDYRAVLVSVGRSPCTSGMGLEEAGVALERGRIVVDEYLRTSLPGVYAAGDCTAKIMLAHYAAYQGELAVHNMRNPGALRKADSRAVPGCIFTDPEVASVGLKEDAAMAQGMDVEIKKFDFLGSGMARILDETDGFIKIIADTHSGTIAGASIVGPKATELIAVLGVAVHNNLTVAQVRETIFAHPTLSESIHEALR